MALVEDEQVTMVPIKPGHNVWRIVVSNQLGMTRREVLERMGSLYRQFLEPIQGPQAVWKWPGGQTAYAWGCGSARPIQAWEAQEGASTDAPSMPLGEILAKRTATDVLVAGAFVKGEPPVWWVESEFWWRGQQAELPEWPIATDIYGRHWATLDCAVQPEHQQPMPDQSQGEARSERWERWWETTLEDLPENLAELPEVTLKSKAGPIVIVGGVLLIATYLAGQYLLGRGRR
jgi:hypothetical protein